MSNLINSAFEMLRSGISNSTARIFVRSIAVNGNVDGSIVVGNHNVIGNGNVVCNMHRQFGLVINRHTGSYIKRHKLKQQPPRAPTSFIGREDYLNQLSKQIKGSPAILIYGHDGLGKTALIKQTANSDSALAKPGGVIFIDGVDVTGKFLGPEDAIQYVFDALYESNPPFKVNASTARIYLQNAQSLVILDHFKFSAAALKTLPDLLRRTALVVTSPNDPGDESFLPIPLSPLRREEAIQVLISKAGLTVDETTSLLTDQVCTLLSDVPLAVSQVANMMHQHGIPLSAIAERLAEIQPRSQSQIDVGIERSYILLNSLLSKDDRKALVMAAAAPGASIARQWLEGLAGGDKTVSTLESLEMLRLESTRLHLPDGLQAVVQADTQNVDMLQESLLYRLLGQLESASDFAFIKDELGNIFGLLQWAFTAGRWSEVIRLGKAVDPYLTLHGLWDAWGSVLNQVLEAGKNVKDEAVQAWAYHQLGTREVGVGQQKQEAIKLLFRALRIRVSLGDKTGTIYTLHNILILLSFPPEKPIERLIRKCKEWVYCYPRELILSGALLALAVLMAILLAGYSSLNLKMSADPISFNRLGQGIRYDYAITNIGFNSLAGPIFVTDKNAHFLCGNIQKVGNNDNLLDWRETVTCSASYTIIQPDIDHRSVTNTARAQVGDSDITSRSKSLTIPYDPKYLILEKQADRSRYSRAGETVTFAYTVTNAGQQSLAGSEIITDDKTIVRCPSVSETGNHNDLLDPRESLICTAIYTIKDTDITNRSVTNTAQAHIDGIDSEPDSVTLIFEPIVIVKEKLTLIKTAAPVRNLHANQTITYSYVVTNHGDEPLPGPVTVTDGEMEVFCPMVNLLAPREPLTCAAPYRITDADIKNGSRTNTAWATAGDVNSEPVSYTIYFAPVDDPDLELTQIADPQIYGQTGQEITYKFKVVNQGRNALEGAVMISDVGTNADCSGFNTVGNKDHSLDPGEEISCTGHYTITAVDMQNGLVTNTAQAHIGEVDSNSSSVTIYEKALELDISATIHKSASGSEISATSETYTSPGDEINYTYKIIGRSIRPLRAPVTAEGNNHKVRADCPDLREVGNRNGFLDWGETIECTAKYVTTQADIDPPDDADRGSVTMTAVASVGNINSDPISLTIQGPELNPQISLAKNADPINYDSVDQVITYTYSITNSGNVTLPPVFKITDDHVNNGAEFDCPTNNQPLPPNKLVTCIWPYRIIQADFESKSVTNRATASVEYRGTTVRSAPASTTITCPYPASNWVAYTVKDGDTLSQISAAYDDATISVSALQKANCIGSRTTIYRGETLYVPYLMKIMGTVFRDIHQDGSQQNDEPGIPGFSVTLENANGKVIMEIKTNPDGYYEFEGLLPANYWVLKAPVIRLSGKTGYRNFGVVPVPYQP